MTMLTILTLFSYFTFSQGSYHWIVTETGRIEQKLDGAFPIRRSFDLPALLEQEQRVTALEEMNKQMQQIKISVDQQWSWIELENGLEKRLYTGDPNCQDDDPKFVYTFTPYFSDFIKKDRPKLRYDMENEPPPDCRKYHKLDFSLLTFPHLKSLRDSANVTNRIGEVESITPFDVDLKTMLALNRSDWTAYNLAVRYWELRGNASNAIECARRAIFFAPHRYRHVAIFNLGTLLHAMESFGEAAIVLHTAVDLDRSYYRSHVALGHVYFFLSDYARAVGCYENALSLRPDLTGVAKLRAAVLCYQRLITGLRAIDAALKTMVDDLRQYTKLQEQWVWTNTKIGVERACGVINTPSLDNLRSLWKNVEYQTMRLAERMSWAQALIVGAEHPARIYFRNYDKLEMDREFEREQQKMFIPEKEEKLEPRVDEPPKKDLKISEEKTHRRKVGEFYTFMNQMSYKQEISEDRLKILIIEKLVALQNDFKGDQPKYSVYWDIVRRCSNRDENDVLLFECGHKIFSDYIELVNSKDKTKPLTPSVDDFDDEELELLDESTIENYVEQHSNDDHSEL